MKPVAVTPENATFRYFLRRDKRRHQSDFGHNGRPLRCGRKPDTTTNTKGNLNAPKTL